MYACAMYEKCVNGYVYDIELDAILEYVTCKNLEEWGLTRRYIFLVEVP